MTNFSDKSGTNDMARSLYEPFSHFPEMHSKSDTAMHC